MPLPNAHLEDALLVATALRFALTHELHLPALKVCISLVPAHQKMLPATIDSSRQWWVACIKQARTAAAAWHSIGDGLCDRHHVYCNSQWSLL